MWYRQLFFLKLSLGQQKAPVKNGKQDSLQGNNVTRRRQGRQHAGIDLEEGREVFPPVLQGGFLRGQALLHLGLAVLSHRVVHVDEDLVEDDGQLAHAHKARRRVGGDRWVFDAVGVCQAEGRPRLVFIRVVDCNLDTQKLVYREHTKR